MYDLLLRVGAHVFRFVWHYALIFLILVVNALPARGSYVLYQSGLTKRQEGDKSISHFVGAILLAALAVWLFFALHPWWHFLLNDSWW